MARRTPAVAAAFGAVAVFAVLAPAGAGGDLVAFPPDYRNGVMYTSHDNAEAKEFREFYITPAALDAVRKGQPLPSGTVITLARYDVQRDAGGNPVKDANGRFIKIAGSQGLPGDGKAYRMGHRVSGQPAQWRMGVPSLSPRRQDRRQGRSCRLLAVPPERGQHEFHVHRGGSRRQFQSKALGAWRRTWILPGRF